VANRELAYRKSRASSRRLSESNCTMEKKKQILI
jgi:hypothetical protein